MPRKGKKGGRKSKSKAKSKSKPRSRPKPKSKTRSKRKGLLGVITSDVAIKMVKEAVAADEIFHLKQRVVFLRAEREQLKRRVTKREEQQEAVFDTLKQRVFDGQAEIQVNEEVVSIKYSESIFLFLFPVSRKVPRIQKRILDICLRLLFTQPVCM